MDIEDKLTDTKGKLSDAMDRIAELESEVEDLKAERTTYANALDNIEGYIKPLIDTADAIRQEVSDAR